MPPMMPFVHDAVWFGVFAGLACLAWTLMRRRQSPLADLDWRRTLGHAGDAALPAAWFRTTTRSTGNTAFDDWRDGEIARIEAQRRALEARLVAFEAFVDKLKRAKDRETFERFMAEAGALDAPTERPSVTPRGRGSQTPTLGVRAALLPTLRSASSGGRASLPISGSVPDE